MLCLYCGVRVALVRVQLGRLGWCVAEISL